MASHLRNRILSIVGVVALIAIPALLLVLYVGTGLLPAATDLVGITQTTYAPAYSERAFIAVSVGDTDKDVIAALGDPLSISTANEDISFTWHYAGAKSLANDRYWERAITMDSATGLVIDKRARLAGG